MNPRIITYDDKEKLIASPGIPAKNIVSDDDMNEIKEVVNFNASFFEGKVNEHADIIDSIRLAGGGYRVFESMPSLEDLADGEVAFVVSGGVVPDPELVNIVTQLATGATFSGSGLSSSNVPDGSGGNHDNAWNETFEPGEEFENGVTVTVSNYNLPRFVQVDLKAAYTAKKLTMWGGNFDNCIDEFTLRGSNDNASWTILITGNLLRNNQTQEFVVPSPGAYRYYRVETTKSHYIGTPPANARATWWDVRLKG